jgi:hypothetical protein
MPEVPDKKQRTNPEPVGGPTDGDAIPKSLTSSAVVYGVVEIRDRILRLLEKRELVCFMRASKEALEHASRVVYEKISYRVFDLVRRVASKVSRIQPLTETLAYILSGQAERISVIHPGNQSRLQYGTSQAAMVSARSPSSHSGRAG